VLIKVLVGPGRAGGKDDGAREVGELDDEKEKM